MLCSVLGIAFLLFLFGLLIMATVILLVLLCSTHRKNLCLDCCGGQPGLFSPVDLLHRGPHRLIYAAMFGLMSDQFLALAFTGTKGLFISSSPYGQAFFDAVVSKVLFVLLLCLLYGPLFACVNTSRPLLGHITGFVYLIVLMVTFELLNGLRYSGCDGIEYDKTQVAIAVLSLIPTYIFYIILLVWFIYEIVNDIVIKKTGKGILFTHEKNAYLFRYTRHLLNKKEPVREGRWQQLKSFFWVYEKDFRFPLRFLAPLVVMVSIVFKLFFSVVSLSYLISSLLVDLLEIFRDGINGKAYNSIDKAIKGVTALGTIAGLVALVLCGGLLFQMVATVHKHLKLAAQGKFKFYSKKLPSHANILVSSLKYGGYQIGYFVWAFLIFWIVAVVIEVLVLVVGLLFFIGPGFLGPKIFEYFITVVWLVVVVLVHKVMCKFVFLESDPGGKFLAITNRNGFNWFSYFMFLYNGIVGFVSAIIRVFLSLLFGTLLLFRLDHNIMMDGFKFADRGNKVYLGFLYLEHTYNNPVANTFVALLTNQQGERKKKLAFNGPASKKQQVRNRWLVAYTLLNNPSICRYRSSKLHRGQTQEDEDRPVNEYEIVMTELHDIN